VTPTFASSLRLLRVPRALSPHHFLIVLACLAFTIPASLAFADDDKEDEQEIEQPDWYFEFNTGVSIIPNQTLRDGGTSMSRVESDTGFVVGGALGRRVLDLFRAELQISYREGDVDKMSVAGPAVVSDGDISLLAVMANAYYDFDFDIGVLPYVGAGIGWGEFQLDARRKTAGELDIDDSDSVFVYNFMVGATVPISQAASVALGYRYVATSDPDEIGAVINDVSQDIEAEFDAHEVTLGVRFYF